MKSVKARVSDLWSRGGQDFCFPSPPPPQERQESVLKYFTNGYKSSHFSNLFRFCRFGRLGRLIVARIFFYLQLTSPQFSQDIESSCPPCPPFKKPGLDRPPCAALRDKLAIWTTSTQIWHDSILIAMDAGQSWHLIDRSALPISRSDWSLNHSWFWQKIGRSRRKYRQNFERLYLRCFLAETGRFSQITAV